MKDLETARAQIDPRHTALIVVDVENGFTHPDATLAKAGLDVASARAAVPQMNEFIRAARAARVHIVYLQSVYRREMNLPNNYAFWGPWETMAIHDSSWETEFCPDLEQPRSGDMIIKKYNYDAFSDTPLNLHLRARLTRYLSPPLFPVPLRDLPSDVTLHAISPSEFRIGSFSITADHVCHPGPTFGYRVQEGSASLAYLPDHEPALGLDVFPPADGWTSGFDLATDVDLLIHDAQYSPEEYEQHVGWGHSSFAHSVAFATAARAKQLVLFHHDPAHDDQTLESQPGGRKADQIGMVHVPQHHESDFGCGHVGGRRDQHIAHTQDEQRGRQHRPLFSFGLRFVIEMEDAGR